MCTAWGYARGNSWRVLDHELGELGIAHASAANELPCGKLCEGTEANHATSLSRSDSGQPNSGARGRRVAPEVQIEVLRLLVRDFSPRRETSC